jgi:hypothetical protein
VTIVTLAFTVVIAAASWFLLEKPLIAFSRDPLRYLRLRRNPKAQNGTMPPVGAVGIAIPRAVGTKVVTTDGRTEEGLVLNGEGSAQDLEPESGQWRR